MSRFNRLDVLTSLQRSGFLPIFYHDDVSVSKSVMHACAEGGADVFEFTNRGDSAFSTFKELVEAARRDHPRLMLGIGSIVDPHTAALFIQHGADFVVSPSFNPEVAKLCNRRKIAYIPGCASATEISNAEELGCEFVKIFPARELGGPNFLKALRGPMPWLSAVVTGGIGTEEEELRTWFKAGASAVGIGSGLATAENIERQDWAAVTAATRRIVQSITRARA
ncbi:MAG: bifunctional 4-hydroxy-2-oxoglutarate aldolase/2-dehydro-3-deoxy-phosphogluconate aldolase [Deltaproteobacteria bacterium]|nr:bifunctional 4-hydroxy-2-oxoglutarate aldolase/2-dehydro-3-deoxy-phosphogluconate aldolase [Deltaproteobacteria bacterium]